MSTSKFDVNTYSQDGRIIQVEYAMKAISLGTTTIGVVLQDYTILISEKKLASPLQLSSTVRKHFKIYDTIVAGVSGVSGDAPHIIELCQQEALNHEGLFNEQISAKKLMETICALALQFGEKDASKKIFSRPFGVSILVGVYERGAPKLYCIDPSGSYLEYKAHTIGSASEVVASSFLPSFDETADKEACIRWLISVLKEVMKDKMTKHNVEISCVGKEGVEMFSPEQIEAYVE